MGVQNRHQISLGRSDAHTPNTEYIGAHDDVDFVAAAPALAPAPAPATAPLTYP